MYVCDSCVDEEALQEFIQANAVMDSCDFCGREAAEAIACDFDDFKHVFASGIAVDWDNALDFMPRDGDGWALDDAHTDIYDLLTDGELDVELHPALFQAVVDAFIDISYAPRYYFDVAPDEALRYGWERFVTEVMHTRRYFFGAAAADDDDPREISPADMMSALGRVVAERQLVRPLVAGAELFRGRLQERGLPPPAGAKELGTPPADRVRRSSRMSPNGIAMFYGTFDEETAVAETVAAGRAADEDLTIGVFRTHAEMQIVDLVDPPPVLSRFLEDPDNSRPALRFLHRFVDEAKRPVDRNEREHLEYVPTQIVTEYFRHIHERGYGERVDGISYRSAANDGGASVVLFVDNGDCADEEPRAGERKLVLVRQYSPLP